MGEFNIIADALPNFIPQVKTNIVALDGAAEFLRSKNIIPAVIIGDFDKVTKSTVDFFAQKDVVIEKLEDQNSTDLDKGIKYCLEHSATSINIYNSIGGRLDHTLYNTRILKKYYSPKINIKIFNEKEVMQCVENCTIDVHGDIGNRFSLISAPYAKISSSGLQYDMEDYVLEYGKSESACNALKTPKARIMITGSALIIYELGISVYCKS